MVEPGYGDDKCHFNFRGCKKIDAGYQRADLSGKFYDCCENCVKYEKKTEKTNEES